MNETKAVEAQWSAVECRGVKWGEVNGLEVEEDGKGIGK